MYFKAFILDSSKKLLIYLAFSNYIVCIVLPTPGLLVRLMFATKGIVLHFSFSIFQTYSQAKVHCIRLFHWHYMKFIGSSNSFVFDPSSQEKLYNFTQDSVSNYTQKMF